MVERVKFVVIIEVWCADDVFFLISLTQIFLLLFLFWRRTPLSANSICSFSPVRFTSVYGTNSSSGHLSLTFLL